MILIQARHAQKTRTAAAKPAALKASYARILRQGLAVIHVQQMQTAEGGNAAAESAMTLRQNCAAQATQRMQYATGPQKVAVIPHASTRLRRYAAEDHRSASRERNAAGHNVMHQKAVRSVA